MALFSYDGGEDWDATDDDLAFVDNLVLTDEDIAGMNMDNALENFYNVDLSTIPGHTEESLNAVTTVKRTEGGNHVFVERAQFDVPEERRRLPYTYTCNFPRLVDIHLRQVKGTDNVGLIHAELNSPLNLVIHSDAQYASDPLTKGIHDTETAIVECKNIVNGCEKLMHFLNPTVGLAKKLNRDGPRDAIIHYVIEESWSKDRKEIAKKDYIAICNETRKMIVEPKLYNNYKLLPRQFFYVGYSSHLLHEKVVTGVGYEFNPIAGQSVGVPLIRTRDNGDHFEVDYVKKGNVWTVKYYKSATAYRYNSSVLTSPGCKVNHSMAINIVTTSRLNLSTKLKVVDNNYYANCYERLIRPLYTYVNSYDTPYGPVSVGMYDDKDGSSRPSVLVSPPFESAFGDMILRNLFPWYVEFDITSTSYLVRSSLSHCVLKYSDEKVYPRFGVETLQFPSVWQEARGKWALRAYPEMNHSIIKSTVQGVADVHEFKDSAGKIFSMPAGVDKDGYVIVKNGCYALAGNVTVIYYPNKRGVQKMIGEVPMVAAPSSSRVVVSKQYDTNHNPIPYLGATNAVKKTELTNCIIYDFGDLAQAERFQNTHKGSVIRNVWRNVELNMPINGYRGLWDPAGVTPQAMYKNKKVFLGVGVVGGLEYNEYYKSTSYYADRYDYHVEDATYFDFSNGMGEILHSAGQIKTFGP